MSRLFSRMAAGELALGVYIKGGPHIVPTLAKAGFDFVRPDMMFSSIDWKEMNHIILAAKASGITSWVRVQSNPWVGGEANLQVAVDAARAFSIGAEVVQVSVASLKQVEALLEVAKDWHRSGTGQYPATSAEYAEHVKRVSREAWMIPSIETLTALREIEQIIALKGLKAIFIACTDMAEQLGHPFGYDHPEVWAAFDKVVAIARSRDIVVVANTGYVYNTRETIAERVKKLYDHGARIVMIQGIEFLMENFCRDMLQHVRGRIA